MFDTVHACTPNINSTPLKKNVLSNYQKVNFSKQFQNMYTVKQNTSTAKSSYPELNVTMKKNLRCLKVQNTEFMTF